MQKGVEEMQKIYNVNTDKNALKEPVVKLNIWSNGQLSRGQLVEITAFLEGVIRSLEPLTSPQEQKDK